MGLSMMCENDLFNQSCILWTPWLAHRYYDLTGIWLKWKSGHNKLNGYYKRVTCDFGGDNVDNEVGQATVVDDLKFWAFFPIFTQFRHGYGFLEHFTSFKTFSEFLGVEDKQELVWLEV